MWHSFFIPFEYCMMDSFMFLYAAPLAYLTKGSELRRRAFNEYTEDPATWEYAKTQENPFPPPPSPSPPTSKF